MGDDLIRVAVRIRPLVPSEIEKGCQECLSVVPGEQQIQIRSTDKAFTFNYVFNSDIGQAEFYETAIKKMITHIFQGKILKNEKLLSTLLLFIIILLL